jgi:hypothetical protein
VLAERKVDVDVAVEVVLAAPEVQPKRFLRQPAQSVCSGIAT